MRNYVSRFDFLHPWKSRMLIAAGLSLTLPSGAAVVFTPSGGVPVGPDVTAFASGDFNGDGRDDLVVSSVTGEGGSAVTRLSVLLSKGDGTFDPVPGPTHNGYTGLIKTGDVNGDGRPDMVLVAGPGQLLVYLGAGGGTFKPPSAVAVPSPEFIIGDFIKDGKPDLLVSRYSPQSPNTLDGYIIYKGAGDGTFEKAVEVTLGDFTPWNVGLRAADVNADGLLDLLISMGQTVNSNFQGDLTVKWGVGNGTFQSGVEILSGNINAVLTGDYNRDGFTDLLVTTENPYRWDSPYRSTYLLTGEAGGISPDVKYLPELGDFWPGLALPFEGHTILAGFTDSDPFVLGLVDLDANGATAPYLMLPADPERQQYLHAFSGGDFNGDRLPDLVTEDRAGTFRFWLAAVRPDGDVTEDGGVDVRDAALALRSIVGLEALTPDQKIFADLTKDGQVDVRDVILILKLTVGVG